MNRRSFYIFLFVVTITAALFASVHSSSAAQLIVPIGTGEPLTTTDLGPAEYVRRFYQWAVGFAALLAMAQLVIGGLQYVLAAGSISSKETANERMRNAVTGLIILLAIVLILNTINPRLLNITPVN